MWFMKYIANPFVRLILRSPLHGWFSVSLLLITVYGRKSGKAYSLPVNYAQSGDTLWVLPGMPEVKTWWRNLKGGAQVEVLLRGQPRKAYAEVVTGDKDPQAAAEGLRVYFERIPASARMRQINRGVNGAFDAQDIERAAASSILVRVKL